MKRFLAAALFSAAFFFSLNGSAAAQTTRTYSLGPGDTIAPSAPSVDLSGETTYYGGLVAGQVAGSTPGTFTLSVTFRSTGMVDAVNGIYGGMIVSPYSSFSVTQSSGRKSVSTSGTIESGTVTYRLSPEGLADIVSVSSNNLIVWEGKNKRRTQVGTGTVDFGTSLEGSGTLILSF